ncbi:hypothetical protein [Corynebacterium tapiri]|uniref:SPOR domain-containing protein n=1 Tax=Corynebacterium tapiri TaxID=1448266 RepID=A0A5C4U671_9CORY|nr:hypothetical protein [Corynebacterium tapiri]TNL98734.1 hypothetical protein FHE74_03680 [Corynebacterium tapiri]
MTNQWFFNPSNGEVSQGKEDGITDRMGPYGSREEAENALKIADERTKAADAYDEQDENWGA